MLCLLFTHVSVVMTTSVLKECLSTLVDGKYLPCLANGQFFFLWASISVFYFYLMKYAVHQLILVSTLFKCL